MLGHDNGIAKVYITAAPWWETERTMVSRHDHDKSNMKKKTPCSSFSHTMPSLSRLSKITSAAALILAASTSAQPASFFQQSVHSLSNIWHHGQEIISQSNVVSHHCSANHDNHLGDTMDNGLWHSSSEEQQHRQDGFLKSFSHPAFPEYSMRYKTPEICDPTVKQVGHCMTFIPRIGFTNGQCFPENRSVATLTLNRTNTFSFGSSSHVTIHKKIHLYYGLMVDLDAHPCWGFLQS